MKKISKDTPSSAILLNEYKALANDCTSRLQALNAKTWETAKALLKMPSSYEGETANLDKSIQAFVQLLEDSHDSYYRRLDLLGEMLESDLQILPIKNLKEPSHQELSAIAAVTISYYEQNAHLITKE